MPSSSCSSRRSATSKLSPGSIFPPGNSHLPACAPPTARWQINNRALSTIAPAVTRTIRRSHPPIPTTPAVAGRLLQQRRLTVEIRQVFPDDRCRLVIGQQPQVLFEVAQRRRIALEPLVEDAAVAQLTRLVGHQQQNAIDT